MIRQASIHFVTLQNPASNFNYVFQLSCCGRDLLQETRVDFGIARRRFLKKRSLQPFLPWAKINKHFITNNISKNTSYYMWNYYMADSASGPDVTNPLCVLIGSRASAFFPWEKFFSNRPLRSPSLSVKTMTSFVSASTSTSTTWLKRL